MNCLPTYPRNHSGGLVRRQFIPFGGWHYPDASGKSGPLPHSAGLPPPGKRWWTYDVFSRGRRGMEPETDVGALFAELTVLLEDAAALTAEGQGRV
jgi:hypothetical protein